MTDYPRLGVDVERPSPPAQPHAEPPLPHLPPPSSAWGGQGRILPAHPSTRYWWLDDFENDYQRDMRAIMQDWSVVGVDMWAAIGRGLYAVTRPDKEEDKHGNLTWHGFLAWAIPLGLAAVLLVALIAAIVRGGW